MNRSRSPRSDRRAPTWLFDLDNTLHDASYGVFPTLDRTINAYMVEHLEVSWEVADQLRRRYWHQYGATLSGLIRHHGIRAAHYLAETHRFIHTDELAGLLTRTAGLGVTLRLLPGSKLLVTNAPARYAAIVALHLKIHRYFESHVPIEAMEVHRRLRPKPSVAMLRKLLAQRKLCASRCVMVEDTLANLKTAHRLGLRTVWIYGHGEPDPLRKRRPAYVDVRVKSARQLINYRHHFHNA